MEPVKNNLQPDNDMTDSIPWGVPGEDLKPEKNKVLNPLFEFMGIGSLIYAFFYTFFLYKNSSGITYPFFVGGTCLFFFLYLKKSGLTAKKFSIFITISLILLGISTCLTDSWILIFFNKLGIFCLFFYLVLHNLYEDKSWGLPKYAGAITTVVFSSLCYIFKPFTDFSAFHKSHSSEKKISEGKVKYVLLGIVIALPLLFVILLLLGSADAVFGNILENIFTFNFDFSDHFFGIVCCFLFAFFAAYSIMSRLSVHNLKEETTDKRTSEPLIAITFTGIISFVYLIFCLIQIVYLFGGLGTLPSDYTYASYAREGFFQLVFVCLINLALVLICMGRFRESNVLKGILTFISLCTYIMIASSAYRMILYIQVYYLTFLRVFVLWALSVIFLLMTGALIMIYRESFPLVKYCLIVVTSFYLIFSFVHPDYWIARYNLAHSISAAELQKSRDDGVYGSLEVFKDFYYLRGLSMDAAPVIFEKAAELGYDDGKYSWFFNYASDIVNASRKDDDPVFPVENGNLPKKMSIRSFNFSRWTAYNAYTKCYETNKIFADLIPSYIYDL
ncbi:MAG: DUF4153 domain-containing protein [Suilimivivens sp.]